MRQRAILLFARFNRNAKHALSEALQALLFFGGLTGISFGAWMVYHPLGPILGGIFAVYISFMRE